MRRLWLLFVIACGGPKGGKAVAAGDDVSKCEAGDGEACVRLAVANEPKNLDGTGGNAPLAFAYYKKACTAKSWKGCSGLGRMYDHGIGTPEDNAAAAQHFELACSHDYAMGCWSRARLYHDFLRSCNPAYHPDGYKRPRTCKGHVMESQQKALDLLRKACGLKEDMSCKVVAAYDADPGPVRVKIDDEFNEDWAFEFPKDGEPDWGD